MSVWQNSTNLTTPDVPNTFSIGSAQDNFAHFFWPSGTSLMYRRSIDGGQSYAPKVAIATGITNLDLPFFDAPVEGDIVAITFIKNNDTVGSPAELWIVISRNKGVTWESPTQVDDGVTGFSTGNNKFYRDKLILKDGVLYHCWVSTDATSFLTQGLNFRSSTDQGRTWSATILINSGTITSPSRPAMIVEYGKIHIGFTDQRFGGNNPGNTGEAFYVSRNYGTTTWNTEVRMSTTTNKVVQRVDISIFKGTVCLLWQDSITNANANFQRFYINTSTDAGVTWGTSAVMTQTPVGDDSEHAYFVNLGPVLRLFFPYAVGGLGVGVQQIAYLESPDSGVTWGSRQTINADGVAQASVIATASHRFWIIVYGETTGILQSRCYYGPIPTAEALDDLNRTENPLADTKVGTARWTVGVSTATALKADGSKGIRQNATGTFARDGSVRNDFVSPSNVDLIAYHKVANAGSDGEIDVFWCNKAAGTGYALAGTIGTFGTVYTLARLDATFATTVISPTYARVLTLNDISYLWIDGTDIVGVLDTGSGPIEILRSLDTTYRGPMSPAWEIVGLNDVTSAAIDNPRGGFALYPGQPHLDQSRYPKSRLAGVS